MKRIICTVTNDLNFDQRMIRICGSLSKAGYDVLLVGRRFPNSQPLSKERFRQLRLPGLFSKGWLFYAEFNLRLFFYLLFAKVDIICAIDLDTILPCYLVSRLRKKSRVYDAHELFCEMKEIVSRPRIYKAWKWIERRTVPHFKAGYTVNRQIADEFFKLYSVRYEVIRNLPALQPETPKTSSSVFVLYQGAVNEGRCFETLIPAMKMVDSSLIICGEGNFITQAKQLVAENQLETKVIFKGRVLPAELKAITRSATLGITLFDKDGISNYFSLANRFFDYIQAGIPQVCVDYPAYRDINMQYEVALLIEDTSPATIAAAINRLLTDKLLYERLQKQCEIARQTLNWQQEEKKLKDFYQQHFD